MTAKPFRLPLFLLLALALAGCEAAVLKQSIPVTTNPMGAQVLADGKPACTSPCSVELTRNADHILTFVKPGYMQQDVPVHRKYQAEATMMRAVNRGVQDGQFFNDAGWGLNSGVQSMDSQKETGEAYVLTPATVQLRLTPKAGVPAPGGKAAAPAASGNDGAASAPAASQSASPSASGTAEAQSQTPKQLPDSAPGFDSPGMQPGAVTAVDLMDGHDHQELSQILEKTPSGKPIAWRNRSSGVAYKVIAEPGHEVDGQVVRYFIITAKTDDRKVTNRFPATRRGPAQWSVGMPVVTTQPQEQRPDYAGAATSALKATGNDPTIKKSWSGGSSKSSTSFGKGGMTKTTTKSKVSGSVSVNPLGVIQMLDDFANSKDGQ